METYFFHEGILPPGFSLDFEPSIFNAPEFLDLQAATERLSFYALDRKRNKCIAFIHFGMEGTFAKSPLRGPFGSFELSAKINPRRLYDFIHHVEGKLRSIGIRQIYIKNPPRPYATHNLSMVETFLVNQGYVVSEAEVSALVPVSNTPFTGMIANSETLRLRQAADAGLRFRVLGANRLSDVYDFISKSHASKDYPVSISLQHLQRTIQQFPHQYVLFAVTEGEKFAAASVSVRVNKNVLYNFLLDHDQDYNHLSPPVLLADGTYRYCQANRIELLDLGTSAVDGQPNFPLVEFKLRIGGIAACKFAFYKRIE